MNMVVESRFSGRKWQFTKEEIDHHSPSRNDGVDLQYESHLRKLYCTFLKEIGKKLNVPQLTIASAMLLCHQFYMRQSHAKNDWQTIASACIFLACKVEETPRFLNDVVVVTYEMINKWDPAAPKRIRQKEVLEKQKEVILVAENFLLTILAFDLNFQLPYKPLVTALKRLNILSDLAKVAWNFVNDWMRSTLCLQYKPHYIAAGSLFLAAKLQKVKLPTEKGRVWWLEFEVSLKQLEEVIQDMRTLLGQDKRPNPPSADRNLGKLPSQANSQSCISSVTVSSGGDKTPDANRPQNPLQDKSHDANSGCESVVEDGDSNSCEKPPASCKLDVVRIREAIKKRKREAAVKKTVEFVGAEVDCDIWIEHELENGIEILDKKQRIMS